MIDIELEEQLVGGLLLNNDLLDRIGDSLRPAHFGDVLLGEIYEAICEGVVSGIPVSPITLKAQFERRHDMQQRGGPKYLVDLLRVGGDQATLPVIASMIREKSEYRALAMMGEELATTAQSGDHKTRPGQMIDRMVSQLIDLSNDGTQSMIRKVGDIADTTAQEVQAAHREGKPVQGILTGLADLDYLQGGLVGGRMITLAGCTSMGKTTLALSIATNIAKRGVPVGFFSLEMTGADLVRKIESNLAQLDSTKLLSGQMSNSEMSAYAVANRKLADLPICLVDRGVNSLETIKLLARRMVKQHDVKVLFLDYLQLIPARDPRMSETQRVTESSQDIKALALDLEIPIVALAQINRNVESRDDKRPKLADLRGSGSIEQDSDEVLFVYRPEYYLSRSEPEDQTSNEHVQWEDAMADAVGKAQVILAKSRHGKIGTVSLKCDLEYSSFSNLARNYQEAVNA